MTNDAITRQRQQWRRAAAGWKKWAEVFAQRDDAQRYLEAGDVGRGQKILEVGAGTGDQTLVLAERVGPEGSVLAIDLSENMVEIAKERVEAAGFDNVTFEVADANTLEIDDGSFDVAVSGFTWMLLDQPEHAAARVAKLLTPGGRFVASVWGPPPQAPLVSAPMKVIVDELEIEPPTGPGPGLFALADPDHFRSILENAGFVDVLVQPFQFAMTFDSPSDYAEFTRDVAVVISDLVEEHAPERSDEIWAKVADSVEPDANPDGSVTLNNTGLLAVGSAPS